MDSQTDVRGIAEWHARRLFKIREDVKEIGLRHPRPEGFEAHSLLVVNTELHHICDPWVYPSLHETWEAWEKAISKDLGYPVYFESINAAKAALYTVKPRQGTT